MIGDKPFLIRPRAAYFICNEELSSIYTFKYIDTLSGTLCLKS